MIDDLELVRFLRNNLEISIEKTCYASHTEKVIQLKLSGEVISEVEFPDNGSKMFDPYGHMEI
jgi:hypothetical protein